jgi:hypothetical protein
MAFFFGDALTLESPNKLKEISSLVKSSSQTKTSMRSAASSSSSTQTNISPASFLVSEPSKPIPVSQPSTIQAFSSSNTQGYILWPKNGGFLLSRRYLHRRSTVLTLQSKARSSMRGTFMPTHRWTIRRFVHPWPTFGLQGPIHYGLKRKTNSRRSVWNFRSLVSIF